jgi:septal ring factor EnvC (AmiA/AmiB activator)
MRITKSIILILFLIGFLTSFSQKTDKLKQKERELKNKISNTKSLIKTARKSQQLTIVELGIINHQIAYREELEANLNYQMRKLDEHLNNRKKQILSLENNLKELKGEYAKMLQYAYKNRNTEYQLIYIFSAESYTKAYHRMQYIKQYKDYRRKQVERIKETKGLLSEKIAELEIAKQKKNDLKIIQKTEKTRFLEDKQTQQTALSALKQNEQQLKITLNKQNQERRNLASAIRKAIEKEMEKQARLDKKSGLRITPETKALAKSFTTNKGRLPWPVAKGEITGKYGKHRHQVVKTAMIENKGIDITTVQGANVRAIFGGKVTSIFIIPGSGKVVMISHGNYRTVYANLKEVSVEKGDEVSTKEVLGTLLPSDNGNFSEVHLEIWKISTGNMDTVDPSLWIYR